MKASNNGCLDFALILLVMTFLGWMICHLAAEVREVRDGAVKAGYAEMVKDTKGKETFQWKPK